MQGSNPRACQIPRCRAYRAQRIIWVDALTGSRDRRRIQTHRDRQERPSLDRLGAYMSLFSRILALLTLLLVIVGHSSQNDRTALASSEQGSRTGSPRFAVSFSADLVDEALDGRLLLMLSKNDEAEPRFQIDIRIWMVRRIGECQFFFCRNLLFRRSSRQTQILFLVWWFISVTRNCV